MKAKYLIEPYVTKNIKILTNFEVIANKFQVFFSLNLSMLFPKVMEKLFHTTLLNLWASL